MTIETPKLVILFGADEFSQYVEKEKLRFSLGPREEVDANTTQFIFPDVSFAQIQATCSTIPFLAGARLVVVEGLLGSFEKNNNYRQNSESPKHKISLGAWESLPELINFFPPTTVLLLLEKSLSAKNPLLQILRPLGRVIHFPLLKAADLRIWINRRAQQKNGNLTPGAVQLLTNLIGANLWAMETELEKLLTYVGARAITEQDVSDLVARAKEANIFASMDAVLEGHPGPALRLLHQLLADGVSFSHIVRMLARQNRLLILTKYFLTQDITRGELTRRLGVTAEFVVQKTIEQARRHSTETLIYFHKQILETELAFKSGRLEKELGLELLVGAMANANVHQ